VAEIHPTAIVYDGTVLGEGVRVLEHAVVGKQPSLGARSTAKREPLPPTVIGDGTVVSTGAIVFAGSQIGARCIVGDQSCIRERVTMADDCILGRGSLIENDTTVGEGTRIQAEAYVTAYSTLEEDVFIAPCVVTTNDNFMGRTEKRKALMKGPTIRRGARIGGGAILCPGIEIGEEAFVGAGAVVTKDVPPRVLVVGSPARVLRDVDPAELRENGGCRRAPGGTARARACATPPSPTGSRPRASGRGRRAAPGGRPDVNPRAGRTGGRGCRRGRCPAPRAAA
jgi:acetyltransferase-like isoleucine patch superfamily enzyme